MVITSKQLKEPLEKALGVLLDDATRVVIDIQADAPVYVYIQRVGSEKLLDFDWSQLTGAEIVDYRENGKGQNDAGT